MQFDLTSFYKHHKISPAIFFKSFSMGIEPWATVVCQMYTYMHLLSLKYNFENKNSLHNHHFG